MQFTIFVALIATAFALPTDIVPIPEVTEELNLKFDTIINSTATVNVATDNSTISSPPLGLNNRIGNANAIALYEHIYHRGNSIYEVVNYNTCLNLYHFNDVTSSANTYAQCFVLWEHDNCRGGHLHLGPHTGNHDNFDILGFNDRASSISRC